MKFTAVFALALAALASAQTVNDIPKCARPCLDRAIKNQTPCAKTNYKCVCKDANFSKVQSAATGCVINACGSDVALNDVLPATKALCNAQG